MYRILVAIDVARDVMAWEVGPLASGDTVATVHAAETSKVVDSCSGAFDASMPVDCHVVYGDPAETILAHADKLGANEIVIGSHGAHPVVAAVLGSVAYRVVQEARVPVVVVR